MPSPDFKRSDRIADLIKVEISEVLFKEVRDPRIQGIKLSQNLNLRRIPEIFFKIE